MAFPIAGKSALSVAANSTSADQINPTYQFPGRGRVTVVAKSSATGMTARLLVNGILVIPDIPIAYTGTAGTISTKDNVVCDQNIQPGRVEFYLTNTTGGALTTDFFVYFEPSGKK